MSAEKLTGRHAAYLAVRSALAGRAFVSDALEALRGDGRILPRDAALATEIALGAVRHARTIVRLFAALARRRPRRLPPALRALLHTAVFQVVWMDRVPLFAAVDEAVALAARVAGRGAGGLVNALLRRVCDAVECRRTAWRDGDPAQIRTGWETACAFRAAVLPDPARDRPAYLAAATGERPARVAALLARLGVEAAEEVLWAAQAIPPTVVHRNPLRIDASTFAERIRAEAGPGVELEPGPESGAATAHLPPRVRLVALPLFREGLVHAQDATQHAAAALLAAAPGERVLDLCAPPGGKSIVIAQMMRNEGSIVACDRDAARLERVRENVRRMGLTCVTTVTTDALGAGAGAFDAAIVDVPCSNSGVIARRPEARLGPAPRNLDALVRIQAGLLGTAAQHVRPGGRLVYATCSIEPQENEQIVAAFLGSRPDWRLLVEHFTLPRWGARLSDWQDGGYAALLARAP